LDKDYFACNKTEATQCPIRDAPQHYGVISYNIKKNWPSSQFQRMLRILSWRLTTLWRNFL